MTRPGPPAGTMTLPLPSVVTLTDAGVLGDPATNHYYIVRALAIDRYGHQVLSADSRRVGAFDFAVTPGTGP